MQLTIETFPKYIPNITLEDIIREMYSIVDYIPNNKEIRLAIDLVKQYRQQELTLFEVNSTDVINNVLQCDISEERINDIEPFSKICFKEIIVVKNGKPQVIKVIRWRNPENLKKLRQRNNSK